MAGLNIVESFQIQQSLSEADNTSLKLKKVPKQHQRI